MSLPTEAMTRLFLKAERATNRSNPWSAMEKQMAPVYKMTLSARAMEDVDDRSAQNWKMQMRVLIPFPPSKITDEIFSDRQQKKKARHIDES